jgi:lysophospholipase L1-like esterase
MACLAAPALACPAPLDPRALPPEATPIPHNWPEWANYVNGLSARIRATDMSRVELVFLGDSLLFSYPPELFQHFHGHRRALNLAIPGDTTATLLYRMGNGHWPAQLRPKLVVLLVGTNNTAIGARPEGTAQAVVKIMREIQQRSPQTRILLLALLPRGADARDPARAMNARVNQLLASCADNQRVFWSDVGRTLVDGAGNLSTAVAFDQLHLSMLGYAILGGAMEEPLRRILGER